MPPSARTYMTLKVISTSTSAIIFQISLTYLVVLKMTPEMALGHCRGGRQLAGSRVEAGHQGQMVCQPNFI